MQGIVGAPVVVAAAVVVGAAVVDVSESVVRPAVVLTVATVEV